jgi:hypothetical protein
MPQKNYKYNYGLILAKATELARLQLQELCGKPYITLSQLEQILRQVKEGRKNKI